MTKYVIIFWKIGDKMSLIEAKGITFKYTDNNLFNNVNFRVLPNEKIGLVGLNGTGKTTFLKILDKLLIPDSGSVSYLPNIKISYLDQNVKIQDSLTIRQYLLKSYQDLFDEEERMNSFYIGLENKSDKEVERCLNIAQSIMESLEKRDFYLIKSNVESVIQGLGLGEIDDTRTINTLSSGQRAKVLLAKILLDKPDVILLDEPTNFLDVEHIDFLKKYLKEFKNSFVLVSHDYDFINDCCNVIYELSNKTFERYKGNLDFYLKERNIRREIFEKNYLKQQAFIKKTKEFIDKNIVRATTSKRAKSRMKMLEKIEVLDKLQSDKKINFNFKKSHEPYNLVLKTNDLVIGYDKPLLDKINIEIHRGEKVLIRGENGVGKTTFLKTILGYIDSLDGDCEFCETADILYYSQDEMDDPNLTCIGYFQEIFPLSDEKEIRSNLARLGIDRTLCQKKLCELSGGELSKVKFSILTSQKSNVLILDEPTNHLDINSKNSLIEALKRYEGVLILVSHEKDLFNDVCDKIIEFRK
jgi:ATPase subunit of ABC transporter with duplicated ATPase domains